MAALICTISVFRKLDYYHALIVCAGWSKFHVIHPSRTRLGTKGLEHFKVPTK
jgi:hypothetical protein